MRKLAALIAAFTAFFPLLAFAATPTVIGTPTSQAFSANTSATMSFTTVSGTNTGVYCFAYQLAAGNPTSATFNGVAMTLLANTGGSFLNNGSIFFIATSTVATNSVVSNFSGSHLITMQCFEVQNTVQSSPLDGSEVVGGVSGGTSETVNITTAVDGDLIIGWTPTSGDVTGSIVADSSGTIIATKADSAPNTLTSDYFAQTTHGTQAMGFHWTGTQSADLYAVAIKFLAPTVVATSPMPLSRAYWWGL